METPLTSSYKITKRFSTWLDVKKRETFLGVKKTIKLLNTNFLWVKKLHSIVYEPGFLLAILIIKLWERNEIFALKANCRSGIKIILRASKFSMIFLDRNPFFIILAYETRSVRRHRLTKHDMDLDFGTKKGFLQQPFGQLNSSIIWSKENDYWGLIKLEPWTFFWHFFHGHKSFFLPQVTKGSILLIFYQIETLGLFRCKLFLHFFS